MDNREICLPGDIAQTYNMPLALKPKRVKMYEITIGTTELHKIL